MSEPAECPFGSYSYIEGSDKCEPCSSEKYFQTLFIVVLFLVKISDFPTIFKISSLFLFLIFFSVIFYYN